MQSRIQRYAQDDLAKSGLRGTRTMTSGSRLKGQLKVRVPLRTPSFLKYANLSQVAAGTSPSRAPWILAYCLALVESAV